MSATKPTKVLIVGASYAGLAAATNLLDLGEGRPQRFYPIEEPPTTEFPLEIIIVDERDGYYHVIGSPLALASSNFAERSWTRFEDVPGLQHPAIKFVHGSVTTVDTESKIAKTAVYGSDGESVLEQSYDYLLVASGLRRVAPVVPASLTRDDYLAETGEHINRVKQAVDKGGVVVIGGGAVGIEMAAELKLVYPDLKVRLIHSRDRLLSSEPLPDDFKDETLKLLCSVGVEVVIGKRVSHIHELQDTNGDIQLTLSDGQQINTSFVINAISHATPTSSYLPSTVLTEEGHVRITPTLHFLPTKPPTHASHGTSAFTSTPNHLTEPNPDTNISHDPHHLAAGDITHWTGIRRCGAAMHMGSYAAHNIHAHIISTFSSPSDSSSPLPYKSLSTHPPMIGLALGNTGIAYSPTEGIKFGPEVLKMMFREDLGFSICWNYMKLGEVPPTTEAGSEDRVNVEGATRPIEEEGLGKRSTEATMHSRVRMSGSASSSVSSQPSSSGESPAEPQTPLNAVEDVNVVSFEDLDISKTRDNSVHAEEAAVAVEVIRREVDVPTTKVSPIRVVEV